MILLKCRPFADVTVVGNYKGREAYVAKLEEWSQIRSTLPEDVVSTVYEAFVVRSGNGAGIYDNFWNIPSTLSYEEYDEIIPFKTC